MAHGLLRPWGFRSVMDMKKTDTAIRLLTLAEAASILKISKRTLHRMIQQKQIPAFKVGGQWRILESRFQSLICLVTRGKSCRSPSNGQDSLLPEADRPWWEGAHDGRT